VKRRHKESTLEQQQMVAFHLYEAVQDFVKECKRIDSLIPCEVSRIPTISTMDEASAIIVSRKDNLLSMIQIICRDHIHWGEKLLKKGWEPQHETEWKPKRRKKKAKA
jgi:hypothetical protein